MNEKPIGELVLSREQIAAGAENVAAQLNDQFAGGDVVIISVVPGGILFTGGPGQKGDV